MTEGGSEGGSERVLEVPVVSVVWVVWVREDRFAPELEEGGSEFRRVARVSVREVWGYVWVGSGWEWWFWRDLGGEGDVESESGVSWVGSPRRWSNG